MTVSDAVALGRAFAVQGQQPEEITQFLEWAQQRGTLGRVVEIGQGQGGLTRTLCALSRYVVGLDLPDGDGGHSREACEARNKALTEASNNFVGVLGDSQDPNMLEALMRALDLQPIDLLFIDGDHRGQVPALDYARYGRFVRKGGIIAFHDINSEPHPGVASLWNQLKTRHADAREFSIHDVWGGIGALVV